MAYETIDHRNDVIPDDTVYVFACAPDFQTFFKLSILLYNNQPPLFLAPYYMNYTNDVIKMFKTHRLHFGRKFIACSFWFTMPIFMLLLTISDQQTAV